MAEGAVPPSTTTPRTIAAAAGAGEPLGLGASVNGGGPQSLNQDLWGSILDSVAGKRGVVTKNVIVLGTLPIQPPPKRKQPPGPAPALTLL